MVLKKIKFRLMELVKSDSTRTTNAKINILFSFGIKGLSILISFLLVPLTMALVNQKEYGIWLTLSTIIGWIGFFDIGITNGMRNNLAEALAHNELAAARSIVSTAFIAISMIMCVTALVFLFVNIFLDWSIILNTGGGFSPELNNIALVVVLGFCFTFILKLVNVIYLASQKSVYADFILFIGQILVLAIVFFLSLRGHGSLWSVAIIFTFVPIGVFLVFWFTTFSGQFKKIRPSYKFFDKKYLRSIVGLGIGFFLTQISGLVIFAISNFLIAQLFGPEQVTVYNIAYKYFYVIIMFFTIVVTPFWSASTDAFAKKDFVWLRGVIGRLQKLMLWVVAAVVLMVIISDYVYAIWVGSTIKVPFMLSVMLGIYAIIFCWCLVYAIVLSGSGKIRISSYISIINIIIYLPLAYCLSRVIGVTAIIVATTIILIGGLIQTKIQVNKLINGTAEGIWNK